MQPRQLAEQLSKESKKFKILKARKYLPGFFYTTSRGNSIPDGVEFYSVNYVHQQILTTLKTLSILMFLFSGTKLTVVWPEF